MSLATYTLLHVVISLVGIGSGLIVMCGFFIRKPLNSWTALFLITTVLTSVTGFLFPFEHLLPSHILGILSLIVLAAAIPARYVFHMTGAWRWIYVIGASTALYLNVFVLVAQLFLKIPIFHALAPTQKEPPFAIAQLVVLAIFAGLTIGATRKFHIEPELERPRAA